MSLNETDLWLWDEGETTCETENETSVKHMMKCSMKHV
jgi:ABC-type transport system involved in cytochrome c biogenesis ATPase subunit